MQTTTTLQDLIIAVADAARDLTVGTTTNSQAQPTKMQAGGLAGRRPNHWQHSEIFFPEPMATAAGRTGINPFVVTAYVDGVFTLDHDFGATGVPVGVDFYIVRNHGQGNPLRSYIRALQRAIENLGVHSVVGLTGVSTSAGVYTYTIPAGLDTVFGIEVASGSYGPYELRPDQWDLLPGRGIRLNGVSVDFPWNLTIRGRLWGQLPAALDGTILVDKDDAVDLALEYLFRTSNKAADQGKGQNLQAERIKFKTIHAYPNEMRILP